MTRLAIASLLASLLAGCPADRARVDSVAPDATIDVLQQRDHGTPAICAQLEQDYAAALLLAKRCTPAPPADDAGAAAPDASSQCTGCYAEALACPCPTPIASSDDSVVLPLRDILSKWQGAGCPRRAGCPTRCTIDFTWPDRGCEDLVTAPRFVHCSLQSAGGEAICSADVVGP